MSSPDEKGAKNGDSSCGDRVDTPNPNDVLCGRGGNINSHRGNEQFRSFVEKRKRVYLTARFKREKRLIASSIVNEIRAMDPPGRFLARKGSMKDNSGYWYDIGDEKARDKTSQALRENAPSIRAEIETEISQQRAEMRRQETTVEQPSTSSKPAPSYPPPPIGHHHANGHGTPPHGQPPPHLGHPYNPAHQSHYTQQYYDYYYHYYGYGAPPPPPPPGYTGNATSPGAPPPTPPPGYPPPPPPYWAGQNNPNASTAPPVPTAHPPHPSAHITSGGIATDEKPPVPKKSPGDMGNAAVAQHPPHAAALPSAHDEHLSGAALRKQEDEDRRLAMALQQEENIKAFEDRNRRFGSDRRSSRSTAYCAPGYRPRLLNDSVDVSNSIAGSSPGRKKRPPMSASHFFGPPVVISSHRENTTNNEQASSHAQSNPDTSMSDAYEMDLKPPAVGIKSKEIRGKSNGNMDDGLDQHDIDHQHNHDFSCSSLSSRKLQFKDDSDIMSLFGEGNNIIPSSNANSTGSFTRVRNMFAGASSHKSNTGNHNYTPIALHQGERNHRNEQQLQQREASRHNNDSQHQDSSLLSQVAHHILGNFGVGGSWTDNDAPEGNRNTSNKEAHAHHHGDNMAPEMEMELGQEVIMDVRDESSSMPPPLSRGSGTQVDWASRAGCHSWIPDAIGYNATPSSQYEHHENNREQHGNHNIGHHLNDHSLTRQSSYSRADISPINSMDMDFSRSSLQGGSQRAHGRDAGRNSHSIMNVFDQKTDDSHPEDLLPQLHRSALQQVPSWERSYRSRSEVSLGDMSSMNGIDDSLIRVNSHVVKDKLFKKKVMPSMPSGHEGVHQPRPEDGDHQIHQHGNHQVSHDMDMDWD